MSAEELASLPARLDSTLCLAVFGYAAASALLSEAVSWVMIFRTPDYHRLKNSLEKANQRLDKKKLEEPLKAATTVASKSNKGKDKGKDKGKEEGKQDKKLTMLEKEVETTNRDLTLFKVRSAVPPPLE